MRVILLILKDCISRYTDVYSFSPVSALFFLPQPASRPTTMVSARKMVKIFFIIQIKPPNF